MNLPNDRKLEIIRQLAGGVSHDFNNRIGVITGFANLIRMKAADDKIKNMAGEILNASKNSGDLIRELLNFARNKPANIARISAHDVIDTVARLISGGLDKRVEVKSELKAERHFVTASKVELMGALLNLALNLSDAMPEGGVILFSTECADADGREPRGAGTAEASGGFIRISVSGAESREAAQVITLPLA